MERRRFKQTQSLEERLSEEAKRLRAEAKLLPPGAARDEMIRRARQAETDVACLPIASFRCSAAAASLLVQSGLPHCGQSL
jgi:hypothetical protein